MSAGTPVQARFRDDELETLDRYRREQPNPPTRGKALRELARAALRNWTSAPDASDDKRASAATK
jgi:hypothetical protein